MNWNSLAGENDPGRPLRWYETYMVRRFHPRRIFIDAASLPWVALCIWRHQVEIAVVVLGAAVALGVLATNNVNVNAYARTVLGRLAFLHLQTNNVILQLAGVAGAIWALWNHSTSGILASLTLIFLGHMSGWDEFFAGNQYEVPAGKSAA